MKITKTQAAASIVWFLLYGLATLITFSKYVIPHMHDLAPYSSLMFLLSVVGLFTGEFVIMKLLSNAFLIRAAFVSVVCIHMIIVLLNITAIGFLACFSPWYISAPLITFIFSLSFNHWECPLTMLENELRKDLGMRQIGGFIGHYIIKPLKEKMYERKETK